MDASGACAQRHWRARRAWGTWAREATPTCARCSSTARVRWSGTLSTSPLQSTFRRVVRHWIRRDKLAVHVSVQQLRAGDENARGVVIGVAWYDLW